MIELEGAVRALRATAPKYLQPVRTRRVHPDISIKAFSQGYRDLSIRIRKIKDSSGYSLIKSLTDAKKIHAWMIWNLPGQTYQALQRLIQNDGLQG